MYVLGDVFFVGLVLGAGGLEEGIEDFAGGEEGVVLALFLFEEGFGFIEHVFQPVL